jgi:DNA-damage-inducible protein D
MESQQISLLHQSFDGLAQRHPDGDVEFWYARELMTVLGYSDWRNFLRAIDDARQACQQAGGTVENHFVDATKMVFIGSGAQREVEDIIRNRWVVRGIAPEKLPAAEDLKKLERRVRSAEKKMIKGTELPGGAGEEGGGV